MTDVKRTPGQAEGTEQDIDIALDENAQRRQARADAAQRQDPLAREPGTTPGQAEGTEAQAEGSLKHQS